MAPVVLGRHAELAQLTAALAAVPAGPRVLLVEGPPGIGKTTVWQAAIAAARQRAYQVLVARGSQAEATLPFAALCDLLEGVLDATLPELPAPQRRALEVALGRADPGQAAVDQLAVSLAVRSALDLACDRVPTVVAVDDLQWLDPASARVLGFALRRLGDQPLGVVATLRAEEPGPAPLELERALPEGRLGRVWLGPLPVAALDVLLRQRCQLALPRPVLLRLHRLCAGNPFYALELARALPPGATLAPGEALSLPGSLAGLLRERLSGLPGRCQVLLLAAAALAQPSVGLLERLGEGLEEALAAGVLVRDGDRVGFAHPLLGSLAYANATPAQRRGVHRRLAGLLDDPEERALHLALAAEQPDEQAAAALDAAAERAAGRGAPEAAAQLAEQAGRLTPPGGDAERVRRELAAADHHLLAGDGPRCRAILEQLVARLPAGPARADALSRLAEVVTDITQAVALDEQALAEAGDDPARRAAILDRLGVLVGILGDYPAQERHNRAAVAAAEQAGDPTLVVLTIGNLSSVVAIQGKGIPRELMARALALAPTVQGLRAYDRPELEFGMLLTWAEDLPEARRLLDAAARWAVEHGDATGRVEVGLHQVELELRAGNWQLADRLAAEGLEVARQAGAGNYEVARLYSRALVDAHLGRVEAARAAAEQGSAMARASHNRNWWLCHQYVLGFLALSLEDAKVAHAHLGPLVEVLAAMGVREPSVYPVLPNDAEALVALGRLDQAGAILEELDAQGRAQDRAWALAGAARGRALLAAARGNPTQALDHLEDALAQHKRLGYPFELARTLHAHGVILRRDKQKAAAKATLEHALGLFEQLGAGLWAQRARAELGRVGLRPPAPSTVTTVEAKVAELAAAGRTNQEIAQALFMSIRTVEAHLSRVYRKLGIRSRTELAHRLARKDA
jgi:DNA-binding CsgD family transcriptional regulator